MPLVLDLGPPRWGRFIIASPHPHWYNISCVHHCHFYDYSYKAGLLCWKVPPGKGICVIAPPPWYISCVRPSLGLCRPTFDLCFSLAYFVEKDHLGSKYTSIPESMWWAIQTMTSVSMNNNFLFPFFIFLFSCYFHNLHLIACPLIVFLYSNILNIFLISVLNLNNVNPQ